MSQPQRRPQGQWPTLLTDRSIRAFVGDRWLRWHLSEIMEVRPAPVERAVIIMFNGSEPLRLSGPWATWCAVALVHLVFGGAQLAHRPEFAPYHQQLLRRSAPPQAQEPTEGTA